MGVIFMYVDYGEVGKRIAQRRKELGYKQFEVNEKAELSEKYLSNIERGKSVISIETLMKLCTVLEATPSYFLLGSLEKVTPEDYEQALLKRLSGLDEKKLKVALSMIDWLVKEDL
jgi:transcriptional regulator with XRE-family HTH domain